MKLLGAIIIFSLFLLAVFTLANWSALTAPTALSFIVFEVNGPLGAILLGAILVLTGLFVLYALSLRAAMLLESRRHHHELEAQRKLAERAEASRLAELRTQMEKGFDQMRLAIEQNGGHIQGVEQSIRQAFDETANGLAANIGEVEEKLDRVLASHAP